MTVGSLFAGIGGFDLGFERVGMRVLWQVERDPYCRAVLARQFPEAERFRDVRVVSASELAPVDLLCGGFPCQDLSRAGRGAGIEGPDSGLWAEFSRLIGELRPGYVVVENVPTLLTGRGKRWDRAPIGRVLGDLSEMGYDAEWAVLSAREFGAPHLRKRVWIVAYPNGQPERPGLLQAEAIGERGRRSGDGSCARGAVDSRGRTGVLPDANGSRLEGAGGRRPPSDRGPAEGKPWATEPGMGRVADGIPNRMDRLSALGNSLVPQIAEWIGHRIMDYERTERCP